MTSGSGYVHDANRSLRDAYEDPMSLKEYVESVFDEPSIASHASKYVLQAIEASGTRTVIEKGEEKERYRFFDDPHNDGEHAILGNTEMLNGFVDDLRAIASGRGKIESIIWITGPTATGKSELKRCLINGLREYSKTPEGRRYTLEWNLARNDDTRGLSYGSNPATEETNWHESPVQVHPLSVFPEEVRKRLLDDLNTEINDGIGINSIGGLDPFSRDTYENLEETYRQKGDRNIFSRLTDDRHLRISNYVVDVGHGIGVLTAEDSGSPKTRLVGSWMAELFRDLESLGRKNPQAFSYDGVLSQGNGGLTIVEDASQHADLIQKLLSVPEEQSVKLDKGIEMDVDTQLLIISNPDLEAQLNQHEDRTNADPLKALKRRLNKREFRYLTNLSLEAELIRRELLDEHDVWEVDAYEVRKARTREAVTIPVRFSDGVLVEREFAPHAIEAAALYDVVSRFRADDLPGSLDFTEKAILFDQGYLREGDERLRKEDFEFSLETTDGEHGIPVTYTRDILSELLTDERDRRHSDLPVEHVVMPQEVLGAMRDGLRDAPVFSQSERDEYEQRVKPVGEYILDRQEEDVLNAILETHGADEETVVEYVENVYAWVTGEALGAGRDEQEEPDPLTMKVFEIEYLGRFMEADYEGTDPSESVASFRQDQVVAEVNRQAWEQRSDDFEVDDINLTTVSVLEDILSDAGWKDVRRVFDDFDPRHWSDPPSGTQTEQIKSDTIQRLGASGYSRASAQLTSQRVIDRVIHEWD